MLPLRYARRWQIAGISVLVLVLAAALVPALWFMHDVPGSGLVSTDKLLHTLTFMFLTVWFCGQYRRRSYWRVAVAMLMFGVLIEACQMLLTWRSAEVGDLVADAVGIVLGLLLACAGAGGWSLRVEEWAEAKR